MCSRKSVVKFSSSIYMANKKSDSFLPLPKTKNKTRKIWFSGLSE